LFFAPQTAEFVEGVPFELFPVEGVVELYLPKVDVPIAEPEL
jgi:hypothetical protein